MDKKPLICGTSFFHRLREEGGYYVDKTLLLQELLEAHHRVNLIARPRRFGKSVSADMISSFCAVEADPSLFDGLAITRNRELCAAHMNQHPVLRLNLSCVCSMDYRDTLMSFSDTLDRAMDPYSALTRDPQVPAQDRDYLNACSYLDLQDPLSEDALVSLLRDAPAALCRILHQHYGRKVIVVIDEYDDPLTKAWERGLYDPVSGFFQGMFRKLLGDNPDLEMAVLVGFLNLGKEPMLHGLEDLRIWSGDQGFSREYFGLTEGEVRDMLAYYEAEDVLDTARAWQGGYHFGAEPAYCPWDAANYVSEIVRIGNRKPSDEWAYRSSVSLVLREFLRKAGGADREACMVLLSGGTIRRPIQDQLTAKDRYEPGENIWSLFVAAGALTALKAPDAEDAWDLRIPNEPVRRWFRQQLHWKKNRG